MRARPVVPPPSQESIGGLGFYPDEEEEYAAIVRTPYPALDERACRWVAAEADIFLPPEHIRYFAPALVEYCRREGDSYYLWKVFAALCKARPLPDAAALAAELRAQLPKRAGRRFPVPDPYPDGWNDQPAMDLVAGRVAMMILTLAPDVLDLGRLAREATGAMAVVELGFGVFSRGWKLADPFPPWFADQLVAALEVVAQGNDPHAALGARFVRGEVGPEALPRCDSIECDHHR